MRVILVLYFMCIRVVCMYKCFNTRLMFLFKIVCARSWKEGAFRDISNRIFGDGTATR